MDNYKGMSLTEVGWHCEKYGKGRRPTWDDYGHIPRWLRGGRKNDGA